MGFCPETPASESVQPNTSDKYIPGGDLGVIGNSKYDFYAFYFTNYNIINYV